MAVVSCPKCPTKLKVPDGAAGNVKCPKCGTIFPASPVPAAFEVVDEPPARPSAPPPRPAAPARAAASPPPPPPPPPPAAEKEDDFDFGAVVKVKKKGRDDDEDDDDRGRDRKKKRRRDDNEDDEDDRPRSKRRGRGRGRDDDYDDEDDDDDDYDDRDRRRPAKGAGAGPAATGALLLNISFWIYMVVLANIAFFLFLAWVGAFDGSSSSRTRPRGGLDDESSGGGGETLVMLIGIAGLSQWILALVGFGFCIAGPARARGMAITATALSAAHLLFTGLTVNNLGGSMIGRFSGGLGGGTWICWTSMLPFIDVLLPALIYGRGSFPSELLIAFLAGACELARIIFTLLMIKQLAAASKNYDAAEKSGIGVVIAAIIAGVSAALALLVVVLLDSGITKSATGIMNIMMAVLVLIYLGFTAMTVLPMMASGSVRSSLARKARRR